MYPTHHLLVSFVTFTTYAVVSGMEPMTALVWVLVGTVVGVGIDIDHLVLSAVFHERRKELLDWVLHPARFFQRPQEYIDRFGYEGMAGHRLATHAVSAFVLYMLMPVAWVFIPAFVSVALHIITDLVGDYLVRMPHAERKTS